MALAGQVLGRVGVAEHRLEVPSAGRQPLGDLRQREHAGQHVGRVARSAALSNSGTTSSTGARPPAVA